MQSCILNLLFALALAAPFLHALRGLCWIGGVFGTQLKGQICALDGTTENTFRGRDALDYMYFTMASVCFMECMERGV